MGPFRLISNKRAVAAAKLCLTAGAVALFVNLLFDSLVPYSEQVMYQAETKVHNNQRLTFEPEVDIILYAKYRGGSTFGSEFFNKHQDIAFIYEPLCSDRHGGTVKDIHGVLDAVLNCTFHGTTALKQVYPPWYHHQAFCMLPKQTPGCDEKGHISFQAAEKHCRAMPHKVIKVIRVHSLAELEVFMTDPKRNVKVVHLVRDPRGTINSRLKINNKFNIKGNAAADCREGVQDLLYIREAFRMGRRDFTDNYYLVRYEDMASDPLAELGRLYEFIGISPDKTVTDWVLDQGAKTRANDTELVDPGEWGVDKRRRFTYNTRRDNPAFTAQAWRLTMPLQQMHLVQNECKDFLKYFGYAGLTDEYIKNNMSSSVVLTLDRKQLFEGNMDINAPSQNKQLKINLN